MTLAGVGIGSTGDPQYPCDRRGGYQGDMNTLGVFLFCGSLFVCVLARCNHQKIHNKLPLLPTEQPSEKCPLLHHDRFAKKLGETLNIGKGMS